jgi:hypothetical protein
VGKNTEQGYQWLKDKLLDDHEARQGLRRAYVLVDDTGTIRRMHPNAPAMMGCAKEEFLGKSYRTAFSSATYARHLRGLAYCADRAVQEGDSAAAKWLNEDLVDIRRLFHPSNHANKFAKIIAKFEQEAASERELKAGEDDHPGFALQMQSSDAIPADIRLYKFPTEYGQEYAGALLLFPLPLGLLGRTVNFATNIANKLVHHEDKMHAITAEYVMPVHSLAESAMPRYAALAYRRKDDPVVLDFSLAERLEKALEKKDARKNPDEHKKLQERYEMLEALFGLVKEHAAGDRLIIGSPALDVRNTLESLAKSAGLKSKLRFNTLAYPAVKEPTLGPEGLRVLTAPEDLEKYCIERITTLEQRNPDGNGIPKESLRPVQPGAEGKGNDV